MDNGSAVKFYPPLSWLSEACAYLGQTPETIAAYLSDIGVPHIIGNVEEVERACRETPLRPLVLGWPMNRESDQRMMVRNADGHGPDVIAQVLTLIRLPQFENGAFIAIVQPVFPPDFREG